MKLGLRWAVAFSFLLVAVHEAHELAHAIVGRLLCGAWPTRDFNAWQLPASCSSWWPTAAGPLFTYALLLLGGTLAARSNRMLGLTILFAANPFARIFTAAMGGGDEMVVAQHFAGVAERTTFLRVTVLVAVTLICGSSLVVAWRLMRGMAHRGGWFAFAMVWPMVLTGVGLFVIGNRALKAGVLAQPIIAGAPLLVMLVSGAAAVAAGIALWRAEAA